ncbi:lysine 2,3-aminomutase [Limisalsivibrio acetivorans]|uniref:lysine 2,3-aminomutase n=1 Tax=Limisalsivibrio acetivorans TaxID=1304888 RepID=UPI000409334D|nr:lysine 2,3-aminomutase [Limisalsivibrio acetivorans]
MTSLSTVQQEIANKISPKTVIKDWKDWKWQMRHSIKDIETFERMTGIDFPADEREMLKETLDKFPLAVTPYYLSLINTDDYKNDPVYKQCFPSPLELDTCKSEMADPLSEDADSPAPGITHRYPDRVLLHVSNMCAMYCRHCTRKRKVGDQDFIPNKEVIEEGLEYIRKTPVVRDVLLSGGDPFMLHDGALEWILDELSKIEHVEVIRIGTRMPVVLPYRVTEKLVSILSKYDNLWINTHFNHPRELTDSSREALKMLVKAGIPLGNQTVLLAGVNDCPFVMKRLVQKLVKNRVRPYYLYQCDLSEGLGHFRTPVGKGIEIMESLRGHTSGFAVPTYVIDAPGGGGKIPVAPNYVISWSTNKIILRNYEGVICTYKEPESYEQIFCDRECESCNLELNIEGTEEMNSIGIEKLMADYEEEITLIPADNERYERRENGQDS